MQFTDVLPALRGSHERLDAALRQLTAEQASGQSYDDEWTIAQVASHLGSGAEIFGQLVAAGLKAAPAPGADEFRPVWERWNVKSAAGQVADALRADAEFLDSVAALTQGERDSWQLEVFGERRTLTGLLAMRLAEHAVHTWDIVVARDPGATVAPAAVAIIVDLLPGFVRWAGRGSTEPASVRVTTSDPDREYLLEMTPESTRLSPSDPPAEAPARVRLPAEALVRLVYGRLDPAHTPGSVETSGIGLDTLRRRFPGV